jgi:hypothetical protein
VPSHTTGLKFGIPNGALVSFGMLIGAPPTCLIVRLAFTPIECLQDWHGNSNAWLIPVTCGMIPTYDVDLVRGGGGYFCSLNRLDFGILFACLA